MRVGIIVKTHYNVRNTHNGVHRCAEAKLYTCSMHDNIYIYTMSVTRLSEMHNIRRTNCSVPAHENADLLLNDFGKLSVRVPAHKTTQRLLQAFQ